MTEPTDIQLMLQVRDGDEEAFRELVSRYRGPLRRFFAAMLADPSQAEDFTQETFLRLWLSRGRYQPIGAFSTYLYQIGKHHWMNQKRKARPPVTFGFDDGVLEVRAPRQTQPEAVLLRRLQAARAQRALARLPDGLKAVFTLYHADGLKQAEIAQCLGIPLGTVKSRMAEAVRRLRAALSEEDE
ncbi:MAG TPA: sigma-70 family RNA polymerase sigma factor [Armatimonadota bacterium]|jgi:RNA polymerase sigma-70 factor (ECF subfamily)